MPRKRAQSNGSVISGESEPNQEQELGSMYDYLAKIILLGPSGTGKSCLLHRFVRGEWKVLASQTIGVEFSSKIIKVGTGARRKRIKLQLWDTAGQERFRSVTRSYYRGAAGALLIYDITRHASFTSLPTFLSDAKALASPNLTVLLVGNKADLSTPNNTPPQTPTGEYGSSNSTPSTPAKSLHKQPSFTSSHGTPSSFVSTVSNSSAGTIRERDRDVPLIADREVFTDEATRWASSNGIPVAMETSALNGDNVDEVFERLARMILTKIELGEIDVDDSQNGIQYGDSGDWVGGSSGGGGMRSSAVGMRRRTGKGGALREWEDVFRPGSAGKTKGKCC